MAKTFVDTNVFVYALDEADERKHRIARKEIERVSDAGFAVVSTQILQELYNVVTRKLGHEPLKSKALVQEVAENELVVVDLVAIERAIDISILNSLSFWDSLLISAASMANCTDMLTEDMQHDSTIAGVRIVNPFRRA